LIELIKGPYLFHKIFFDEKKLIIVFVIKINV